MSVCGRRKDYQIRKKVNGAIYDNMHETILIVFAKSGIWPWQLSIIEKESYLPFHLGGHWKFFGNWKGATFANSIKTKLAPLQKRSLQKWIKVLCKGSFLIFWDGINFHFIDDQLFVTFLRTYHGNKGTFFLFEDENILRVT